MRFPEIVIGGFLAALSAILFRAGQKVIYASLLLYHAFWQESTPFWAKNIIFGALGYLLAPVDTIPDLTPLLGFTDDIGVLSFGLVNIAGHITDEVRVNARKSLLKLFGRMDMNAIRKVDAKL